MVPLVRDTYLFQPYLYVACHEFVTHVTAKILVAAIQTRGETNFCYSGNKTKSRGGNTCYVDGGKYVGIVWFFYRPLSLESAG